MDMYANLTMQGGARVSGLPNAASATDAVPFSQLQALIEGNAWKDSVRAASTANVVITGPGTTIDAVTLANGDRVLLKNQTVQTENGIYIFNGSAAAMTRAGDSSTYDELESAVVRVEEGTANTGTKWAQTQVNGVIGTNNIVWVSDTASAPAASETQTGVAEIATQAETDAGTDDLRFVTPLKLATWSGRVRKVNGTLGDNSATSFNIDHNFGTRDVIVEVYRNSGNYDTIFADITRPTANRVTITFGVAPTAGQWAYKIVA